LEKIQIANGVTLNCMASDKFKTNYLSMNFITPLEAETAALRTMVPRLLHRGSAAYPDQTKLTERMQTLYSVSLPCAGISKRGENQIISQPLGMLDNSVIPDGTDVFGGAIDLLCEMWFHPLLENNAFSETYTSGEKKSLKDAIAAKINNKNTYAAMRCWKEMCRGERYGIDVTGTAEEVSAADAESIYGEYRNILSRMPCELYYIGRGDTDKLARSLQKAFASYDRSILETSETEVVRRALTVREVEEEQPASQSKLSLGFRTGTCEREGSRPAMLMFNEIYGSSPVSKLFMNVREKLSLCYYCYSSVEQIKGTMLVSCGIEAEKKEVAQAEILAQLDDIRQGNISDAELDAARKSIRGALTQLEDEPESMAAWMLGRHLSGQTLTFAEEKERAEAVTKEDIARIAQGITLDTVYFMKGTLRREEEEEADDGEE